MIRMDGACSLSESLASNHHLMFLDLSYNSLGQHGGELIGKSLLSNRVLKTLLLSNNAIPASGCCAICVGIERNLSLEYVNLDGNPIGEEGAKMLMQLPYTCGKRVKISALKYANVVTLSSTSVGVTSPSRSQILIMCHLT